MMFIPDQEIERLVAEDVAQGDLTTRALGLAAQQGTIEFSARSAGRASGVAVAARVLKKFGLAAEQGIADGSDAAAGQCLLRAEGNAAALHQTWKAAQNILEWCGGVAQTTAALVAAARRAHPHIQIACTRKTIPGTRWLAIRSVIDGGGIMHRHGTAESVLLFANHRRFFPAPFDWKNHVAALRQAAPEKKIMVEADTVEEAFAAIEAQPDVIQLDKFTPENIRHCLAAAQGRRQRGLLFSAAGGIHLGNVEAYAATGVDLIVTSAPYYSRPADVRVVIAPLR